MKTKKRLILLIGMIMLAGLLIAIPMVFRAPDSFSASASSPKTFYPKANFTVSHYKNGEVVSERTGQGSSWTLIHSEGKGVTAVSLSMFNKSFSSADYLNGEYGIGLAYQDITIRFRAGSLNQTLSLFDSAGNKLATQIEKEDINITLEEGEYHIYLTAYANPWTCKDGTIEYYLLEAEFMFHIDLTAPYILGTYSEGEEKWVGIGHTIEAKDDMTWIQDFSVVQPDGQFVRYIDERSYTFQSGDKEGLYTFRAYDNTGFFAGVRTVLFDGTAPVGSFESESGEILESNGLSNQAFIFQANDELSGIESIEYKKPNSDVWEVYSAGTVISNNSSMGKYEFRCVDQAGNESVYSMTLNHDFTAAVTLPTCMTGGYTTYTCNDCDYSYTGDETAALGHKYTDIRVEATCTEKGYTLHQCIRCDKSYRDTPVRELGHDMQPSTVLPSCTESGYLVYSCTRCDESNRTETAIPLGHNYVSSTVAATCTEGGYTNHKCSRCGESYKDNVSQPNGHNFVVENFLPTCTEYGKTYYKCQICDYEYFVSDGTYPTGHSYTNSIIKEPTCTEKGLRRCICDHCGDTYETVIAENGHHFEIENKITANGKTTRIYVCTQCNGKLKQELGNQYEEVTNYVEYLFEQYSPYMWWVLLAAAGVWSIVMGVFFAIAQKNEDKEKSKKMIVNYVIGLVVIAVIVVACPYLIRGIAALVT